MGFKVYKLAILGKPLIQGMPKKVAVDAKMI
jgi:hypothetical protein